MIVYKCDKCGKEIPDNEFVIRAFNNTFYVDDPSKGVAYHLCVNCAIKARTALERRENKK